MSAPAEVRKHPAIGGQVFVAEDANLLLWRPELGFESGPKVFLEGVAEAELPGLGRDASILVGVLVHVERVQLPAVDLRAVQHGGEFQVARPGIGHDGHEGLAGVHRRLDPEEHVRDPEEFTSASGTTVMRKSGLRCFAICSRLIARTRAITRVSRKGMKLAGANVKEWELFFINRAAVDPRFGRE
ncbi:MAG: hypothetical protein WDM96_08380 [Lacunisphaera sp.]